MGGMALDAYKSQQAGIAQQTEAIAKAADVINRNRIEERNQLLKQFELASLIGDDKMRNKTQEELNSGTGILGAITNPFVRLFDSNKMKGVKSSLDTGGQNGGAGGVNENTQAQLDAVSPKNTATGMQHDILEELKANYAGDPDGLKKVMSSMNNQMAGNLQPSGGAIEKSSGRFIYNDKGNLYDTITGVEYDKDGKQLFSKKTEEGFTVPVNPSDMKDGLTPDDYKNAGKIANQKIKPVEDTFKENEQAYSKDQEKYNKMVKVKEAQEKRNFSKDPDSAIKKMLKDEGYGDTYEGGFGEMTSQATDKFQRAIDIAVKHGDYNLAEKLNKQYKVDMYSIHKNWLDKPQMKDISDLFIRPKGGGGKMVWFDFQTIGKDGVSDPQPHKLLVSESEASDPDKLWKRLKNSKLYSGSMGIKPTKGRGVDNEDYSTSEKINVAYNDYKKALADGASESEIATKAARVQELKLAQTLKEKKHLENLAEF